MFTARLNQRYYLPVTIDVSSTNLTASAPGGLHGRAWERTSVVVPVRAYYAPTVSVPTHIDGFTEGAETFRLTFTSSSISNSPRTAVGTIQANGT